MYLPICRNLSTDDTILSVVTSKYYCCCCCCYYYYVTAKSAVHWLIDPNHADSNVDSCQNLNDPHLVSKENKNKSI